MACDRTGSVPFPSASASSRAYAAAAESARRDSHSFANPEEVVVRHLDLDWDVRFDRRTLDGTATLHVERVLDGAGALRLDSRDLLIAGVELSDDGDDWTETPFALGEPDPILGAPLEVTLSQTATQVRIAYTTSPGASGVQWIEPAQTAGKTHPFMFTQSQAIHARSWIPLQDTPGVRVTYCATVRTPRTLRAVMSAAHDAAEPLDGEFQFEMHQPIPSYLIALSRRGSRVPFDGDAHRGVRRAVCGRVGRCRVRRHRSDDDRHPSGYTGRIAGSVTTCWCCRRAFHSVAWRTRV